MDWFEHGTLIVKKRNAIHSGSIIHLRYFMYTFIYPGADMLG